MLQQLDFLYFCSICGCPIDQEAALLQGRGIYHLQVLRLKYLVPRLKLHVHTKSYQFQNIIFINHGCRVNELLAQGITCQQKFKSLPKLQEEDQQPLKPVMKLRSVFQVSLLADLIMA